MGSDKDKQTTLEGIVNKYVDEENADSPDTEVEKDNDSGEVQAQREDAPDSDQKAPSPLDESDAPQEDSEAEVSGDYRLTLTPPVK